MMKESSKKSREERQQEDQHVDDDQEARLPAGQNRVNRCSPEVAVDRPEDQAEHRRADGDEDHEGGSPSSSWPA